MSVEDKSQILNGQEEEVEQYIWIKWEKKYELEFPS